MKRLAYMIPIVLAFLYLDAWLSEGRTAGGARNSVIGSTTRWARADDRPVIVIGSSTTSDLLPVSVVSTLLDVPEGDVAMARINGCHQGCTWAQVRAIMQRTDALYRRRRNRPAHRFEHVFMGVNLFQQCEDGHSKRVMQHTMLTPPRDLPALLALYGQAERPLRRLGRAFGMFVSGVYGEPAGVKQRLRISSAFTLRGGWYSTRTRPPATAFCDYADGPTALKTAFMHSLMDDLSGISKRITLVLLPDRALAAGDADQMAQLPAFRAWAASIAARHANIEVIDFIADNRMRARDFRDTIHFTARALRRQRARFADRYRARRETQPADAGRP